VLTHGSERARRARFDNATRQLHHDARSARKCDVTDCQYRRKRLCRRHFCDSHVAASMRDRCRRDSRWRLKVRCADSESQFLAIKKFSRPTAARLIAARQNRFFARIAATDSAGGFPPRDDRRRFGRSPHARSRASSEAAAAQMRPRRRRMMLQSDAEFGLEQIVDGLRIGLAAG
jgi:hypothetical protein